MTDISFAARDVLSNARVEGAILYLPPAQLERKLYEEVNEVLSRLGGKWKGGKVKGHIFDDDPTSDLEVIVQTGLMPPKNPTAFFATPKNVIQKMLAQLDIHAHSSLRLLEPSAGKGAIAQALRTYVQEHHQSDPSVATIHCCEIVPAYATFLRSQGFEVVAEDFLKYHPTELYDGIVMNPPFSVEVDKQAYVTHIHHAWDMLVPHGALVAIAPAGFTFRMDKKVKEFSTLVEVNGTWEKLPSDSFKESGTGIETVILSMTKPTPLEMVRRIVDKSEQFRKVAEEMEEQIAGMEKKLGIDIPPTPLRVQARPEAPVFGDPLWIERARRKKVS